jgi:hypothetical protein
LRRIAQRLALFALLEDPAERIRYTNGAALPSITGSSGPSISIRMLSMPSRTARASRCSTVPTVASPRPSLVASAVETTSLERAGISTGSPKSDRTNTMPEFARADAA